VKAIKDMEDVRISMDGKGRAIDNVWIERFFRTIKHEYVYLNPVPCPVIWTMNVAVQFSLPLCCSSVTIFRIEPSSRLDEGKICLPNSWAINWTRH
jgi:hypothetical protein